MDAKKPRKCSLTSFPVLKARKKQNVNPVKVKILEFHLGNRGILMKTGGPWSAPHTSDDSVRGREMWGYQAIWQCQVWAGLEGNWLQGQGVVS